MSNYEFRTDIEYKNSLVLKIYDEFGKIYKTVDMTQHRVCGHISSAVVPIRTGAEYTYEYYADGQAASDFFAKKTEHIRKWGEEAPIERASVLLSDFDWDNDKRPLLPYESVISYLLHVRGYTMADSAISRPHRGTFLGIVDKIPYLCDLGVNQLILMPAYEFDELEHEKKDYPDVSIKAVISDDSKKNNINYWGYKSAAYYAPKSAYAVSNQVDEFKLMVKELHLAEIELLMQFYFPHSVNRSYICDILRYWALEYHVDGFYLIGENLPIDMIAQDSYLTDCKILYSTYDKGKVTNLPYAHNHNLAAINYDFSTCMRRFLKSDEDMLRSFIYNQRQNPSDIRYINFITSNDGFTLNDLTSYDYKHNEDNGEDNRDGNNYNYSWNCGVEGPSKKKNVVNLRRRQVKNILTMLFLSSATPMLLSGDENLNSQNGNNNAYCQDNKIAWLDWKSNAVKDEIREFVKKLIRLRLEHPILHYPKEMRLMDYAACGYPDMSYHADEAWRPRLDNHLRHIGIMLCGKYARINRKTEDDFFYLAFNMHWESHDFALPKLPKDLKWNLELFTGEENEKLSIEKELNKNCEFLKVPNRSVAILRSNKAEQ